MLNAVVCVVVVSPLSVVVHRFGDGACISGLLLFACVVLYLTAGNHRRIFGPRRTFFRNPSTDKTMRQTRRFWMRNEVITNGITSLIWRKQQITDFGLWAFLSPASIVLMTAIHLRYYWVPNLSPVITVYCALNRGSRMADCSREQERRQTWASVGSVIQLKRKRPWTPAIV